MGLQQELFTELNSRAQLLSEEVDFWERLTDENTDGMGIHQSQIQIIKLLFEGLLEKQKETLANLDASQEVTVFADNRLNLEQELTATHGIMAIFRFILAQREDQKYFREALDAADLVAAFCYKPVIEQVASWGVISAEKFLAPPLTYLNSLYSPAAFTQVKSFGTFKMPLDGYSERKLPISVISLPFHHTKAMWTFCSIYHEIGHVLDQDLGLDQNHGLRHAISPLLKQHLEGNEHVDLWSGLWLREIIADAFGVLLGGVAFVHAMTKILLLPKKQVTTLDRGDIHPTPYVRIFLLTAFLKDTQVSVWEDAAESIEQDWQVLYGETIDDLIPFINDCSIITNFILNEPLPVLADHKLKDLIPPESINAQDNVDKLARFLRIGISRPNPKEYPVHLVPAAAQMALKDIENNHENSYEKVQERAFKFIASIRQSLPSWLAPDDFDEFSDDRKNYLKNLVKDLDFHALENNF